MRSLHILTSWTLLLAMMFLRYSHAQCDRGWFGTDCTYKCHCEYDRCNTAGECEQGVSCVSGWFGPSCQYKNIAIEFGSNIPSWLTDNNKTTCQPNQQNNSVSISFSLNFHFTWMKLHYTQIGHFFVKFNKDDMMIDCLNMRMSVVDSTEMDVSCQLNSTVDKIILSGDLVRFLCSIFVSGGRNVALKQETRQSSIYNIRDVYLTSDKAVDGNRNSEIEHYSCSHTDHRDSGDTQGHWVLKYHRAVYLYHVVVYNSNTEQQRLRHFDLKIFKADDKLIELHTEHGDILLKYFVSITQVSQPVSKLIVMSGFLNTDLTLCEVETYGDYVCDDGKGGLECDKVCSCEQSEFCFTVTGRCAQKCPAGFYGPKCDKNCTGFCDKQGCHSVSGYCFQCVSGYMGKDCKTVCPIGAYGLNCTEPCPDGCAGKTCVVQNGKCLSCKKGLYKNHCNDLCVKKCADKTCNQDTGYCGSDCPPGKYGPECSMNCTENCDVCNEMTCLFCSDGFYEDNCSSLCPTNCYGKKCEITSGSCNSCMRGFFGNQCNQPCPKKCEVCDFETGKCLETYLASIIAAVAIGAFLIIFFVLALQFLFRRKRPSVKSEEF